MPSPCIRMCESFHSPEILTLEGDQCSVILRFDDGDSPVVPRFRGVQSLAVSGLNIRLHPRPSCPLAPPRATFRPLLQIPRVQRCTTLYVPASPGQESRCVPPPIESPRRDKDGIPNTCRQSRPCIQLRERLQLLHEPSSCRKSPPTNDAWYPSVFFHCFSRNDRELPTNTPVIVNPEFALHDQEFCDAFRFGRDAPSVRVRLFQLQFKGSGVR